MIPSDTENDLRPQVAMNGNGGRANTNDDEDVVVEQDPEGTFSLVLWCVLQYVVTKIAIGLQGGSLGMELWLALVDLRLFTRHSTNDEGWMLRGARLALGITIYQLIRLIGWLRSCPMA